MAARMLGAFSGYTLYGIIFVVQLILDLMFIGPCIIVKVEE
jgi:hypothetical protein